jgi:bromodomain adjacent to zinc finger domain protein 1A
LYRKTLNLYTFTLDEYESSLRHTLVEVPCTMIAEIHIALVNIARERPSERHCAILSLLELKTDAEDGGDDQENKAKMHENEDDWQVDIDELVAALTDIGNSWESVTFKGKDGRDGWEEVLVGFLKDVS